MINQCAYLEAMAKRFQLEDAKPVYTPIDTGAVFSMDQCPEKGIDVPYQEACGHVLWPAVTTWPDMQFTVGILARFMKNPAQSHWKALQ